MINLRPEVSELVALGRLQPIKHPDMNVLARQDALIRKLHKPATDDEARALIQVFGCDECFGLAWTVLHFIESAPGWPIEECLADESSEWVQRLRLRAINGGFVFSGG